MGKAEDSDPKAFAETAVSDRPPPGSGAGSRPSAPTEDEASLTGAHLDHFHVQERLGQGGMGTVYAAWDESLDRQVALKMLRGHIGDDPDQQERFLREARAQAKLNHANVVHIYYIGRWKSGESRQGSLFFAMERIDGETLDDLLERGEQMPPEVARQRMIEVARGLRAAHRKGIMHRDVKPSNLLVSADGFLKIADFGLAKRIREDDAKITQDGAMVGSPLYMAPEQARGLDLDHRADMYALGATFFHLLSGRAPFSGPTGLAIVAQHLSEPAPRLRSVAPKVPSPVARIVDRLLEKEPAARFATYDDLIEALERAAPQHKSYAGFWTRSAAVVLDSAIAGGLIALVGWPGLVVHLAHIVLGHAYFGQTLAKYMLRIRVQLPDGQRIGFGRALVRTVLSLWMPLLVGAMILLAQGATQLASSIEQLQPQELDEVQNVLVAIAIGNGFMTLLWVAGLALAAFHPQKKAIHDVVCGSVVTYRLKPAAGA